MKLQEHPNAADVTPVPDAYVPIIKLKLSGVEIDLLFASLMLTRIPEELESLQDTTLLKNLDDKTVRSLNGVRVADDILNLVPNLERFRDVTRLVKFWARRRGIYSNLLGFFGGITWTILVARVCQLYPHYCASAIVKCFFQYYNRWDWKEPVVLCTMEEQSREPGLMQLQVWNPNVNPADQHHLMPIITPAFPAMNSTHNVSESTKQTILDEFSLAYSIIERVEEGEYDWSEVYRPFPFFSAFPHYLIIEVVGKSPQLFTKWMGWIESKLRHLANDLEEHPFLQVRAWPRHIWFQDPDWPLAKGVFMGISIAEEYQEDTLDLRAPVYTFAHGINEWPERFDTRQLCNFRIRRVKSLDLPDYATEQPLADAPPCAEPTAEEPRAKRPRCQPTPTVPPEPE